MALRSGLIIIIDGCREDYISRQLMPFLYHLKNGGSYARLDVTSSFYTLAEISTGNSPLTTDTSFDFCFDPGNSPFRFLRFIKLPLRLRYGSATREKVWHRLLCLAYSKLSGNWVDFPANIPLPLLGYFRVNPSLIRFQRAERNGSRETLPGILREYGFSLSSVSGPTPSITRRVRQEHLSPGHVLMLHYQEVDKLGHQYGPNSEEVRGSLRRVDSSIEEVLGGVGRQADFVMVFGDHNMEEVTQHIDLWQGLGRLSVRVPRDYVLFLNSPVARFWFNSERARREVREFLQGWSQYGREVTEGELRQRQLPSGRKYGELVFWLKKGVAITPDFYHEYPIKGMHFYFDCLLYTSPSPRD